MYFQKQTGKQRIRLQRNRTFFDSRCEIAVSVIVIPTYLPDEPKEVNPLWLLLIFQQCMQTFARNFAKLLTSKIHFTNKHHLIISEDDRIICCLDQDNTPFLSVRASCSTGCKRTVLGSLKLSGFKSTGLAHLDYHVWGRHAGKVP